MVLDEVRLELEVVVGADEDVTDRGGEAGVEGRRATAVLLEDDGAHREVGRGLLDHGRGVVDVTVEDHDHLEVGAGLPARGLEQDRQPPGSAP